MRFLNRWHSLLFIFSGQVCADTLSMPIDLFDKSPSGKNLHNAIASSVKNISSPSSGVKSIMPEGLQNADSSKEDFLAQIPKSIAGKTSFDSSVVEKKADLTEVNIEAKDVNKAVLDSSNVESSNKKISGITTDVDPKQNEAKEKEDLSYEKALQPEVEKKEKGVLYQASEFLDEQETVVFNFEETDLSNVALYMEKIHKVKFITEDIISTAKDVKGLSGHKITFRTNKVLTKKESWDLFITFLHIAGLDIVPMAQAGFYKIVPFTKASSEAIPTFIGTDVNVLPDNDMIVRYVYFTRNVDPAKFQNVLKNMQAGSAKLEVFSEMRALIFLDRANNIKSLMQIVLEMDRSILPESLSVIKLKRANADDVKTLYQSLINPGSSSGQPQKVWAPGKKDISSEYFPQDVTMITDKRTNSLILLGSQKGINKIEEFVEKYIDVEINKDAPPVFVYSLEYTNAADIVSVLNQAVQYGSGTSAGQYGGVRDGIKYFSKMTIIAEPHSNSVVVNAAEEDYKALLPLIKELDIPQKQIGLEVLIVQVTDTQAKTIGAQISGPNGPNAPIPANQQAQTFAQNVQAQTSGIMGLSGLSTAPVVTQTGTSTQQSYSLKSSLGALLGTAYNTVVNEPGSILVTFGQPIWALFKVLQSMVSVHVVANPFVVVSNNSQAVVSIGEQRRIIASQVVSAFGTNTVGQTNMQSTLGFTITPQINKGNIVNLQIQVMNNQFTVEGSQTSALQDQKSITTNASVANGEVLVLGGLMQEQYSSTSRGVPFLEHIPIFGWFFKSKTKGIVKSHFLVFISPRLIESPDKKEGGIDSYTLYKMNESQKNIDIMDEIDWFASKRDPIQKSFFGESMPKSLKELTGQESTVEAQRRNRYRHKVKVHKLAEADRSRIRSKNKQKGKFNEKKPKSGRSGLMSFDQDFVHLPPKNSVTIGKNTITGSMQQGELHV